MRTDTKEYFQNIVDGIQGAPSDAVAREALTAIAGLEAENAKLRLVTDALDASAQVSLRADIPMQDNKG